jgi:diketogulonate reductase-like aldo/keto reductase
VLDFVRAHDMFLTAYAPLASGRVFKDAKLGEIAEARGVSRAQVALRWLIQQDNVAAIPKAADRTHAEANFAVLDFELTPAEMAAIHELTTGPHAKRGFDPEWAPDWDN